MYKYTSAAIILKINPELIEIIEPKDFSKVANFLNLYPTFPFSMNLVSENGK